MSKTPPALPPRKLAPLAASRDSAPTYSPITSTNLRKQLLPDSPASRRTPTPQPQPMKYRCPGCGLDFAKWSPCLAHLREFGHVEAHELDKSLHADFRRVQEMCALFYTHRLSHRLLSTKVDTSSSDESSEDDQEHHEAPPRRPPVVTGEKKPRRRSKKFNLFALPDKVVFKINAYLDVDSATALFRAVTMTSDRSVDESRVNRWSGSSQGSASTQEGAINSHVEGANLRWSTGHLDRSKPKR